MVGIDYAFLALLVLLVVLACIIPLFCMISWVAEYLFGGIDWEDLDSDIEEGE